MGLTYTYTYTYTYDDLVFLTPMQGISILINSINERRDVIGLPLIGLPTFGNPLQQIVLSLQNDADYVCRNYFNPNTGSNYTGLSEAVLEACGEVFIGLPKFELKLSAKWLHQVLMGLSVLRKYVLPVRGAPLSLTAKGSWRSEYIDISNSDDHYKVSVNPLDAYNRMLSTLYLDMTYENKYEFSIHAEIYMYETNWQNPHWYCETEAYPAYVGVVVPDKFIGCTLEYKYKSFQSAFNASINDFGYDDTICTRSVLLSSEYVTIPVLDKKPVPLFIKEGNLHLHTVDVAFILDCLPLFSIFAN